MGAVQPAEMALAQALQLSRSHPAQAATPDLAKRLHQTRHPNLRFHTDPSGKTGQTECYTNRTYRVSPTWMR